METNIINFLVWSKFFCIKFVIKVICLVQALIKKQGWECFYLLVNGLSEVIWNAYIRDWYSNGIKNWYFCVELFLIFRINYGMTFSDSEGGAFWSFWHSFRIRGFMAVTPSGIWFWVNLKLCSILHSNSKLFQNFTFVGYTHIRL